MTPKILLVEDDPTTSEFMRIALEQLPATVHSTRNQAEALAMNETFDLCLLDVNLPDGRGEALLQRLRARQPGLPAMAHTADPSPGLHTALRASGFTGVVTKPINALALRQAVQNTLNHTKPVPPSMPQTGSENLPIWDDDAALNILGGNSTHLKTLRGLFLQELDGQATAVTSALAANDWLTAHQHLHRLRASAGFVGAARLQAAAQILDTDLPNVSSQTQFRHAWEQTRA